MTDGENRQSMNNQVKPYEMADVEDDGYPDGLISNHALKKLAELKSFVLTLSGLSQINNIPNHNSDW
jgi:hypothetical protein